MSEFNLLLPLLERICYCYALRIFSDGHNIVRQSVTMVLLIPQNKLAMCFKMTACLWPPLKKPFVCCLLTHSRTMRFDRFSTGCEINRTQTDDNNCAIFLFHCFCPLCSSVVNLAIDSFIILDQGLSKMIEIKL